MGMEMDMGPASMDATGRALVMDWYMGPASREAPGRPPLSWAAAPSRGSSSPGQSVAIRREVSSWMNRA